MSLKISEKFYSISGEGPSAGVPAIFVRLQDCVLSCPYCDSKFASRATSEPKYILETKQEVEQFADLVATAPPDEVPASLVIITGGEPLMKNNLPLLGSLARRLQSKHDIEVNFETTLLTSVDDLFQDNIISNYWKIKDSLDLALDDDYPGGFNAVVCPKLDLGCYNVPVAINHPVTEEDILNFYAPNVNDEGFPGLWFFDTCEFKIVFDPENEQVREMILKFLSRWEEHNEYLNIRGFVSIMPMTPIQDFTREKYVQNCLATVDFCKKNNLIYSPRIHIDLWGLKQGV